MSFAIHSNQTVILNLFQDNSSPDRVILKQVQHDELMGVAL